MKAFQEMGNMKPFFGILVTYDRKWIFLVNRSKRKVSVTRGQNVSDGLVHYEYLPVHQTHRAREGGLHLEIKIKQNEQNTNDSFEEA